MKILIVLKHAGFSRHSIDLVKKLIHNNHEVELRLLATPREKDGEGFMFHQIYQAMEKEFPNFKYALLSKKLFKHSWAPIVNMLRGFVDYFRYFDKEYNDFQGRFLQERSEKHITGLTLSIVKILFPRPLMNLIGSQTFTLVQKTLSYFDRNLPVAPALESKIKEISPDIILVTPMVYFACPTNEVVKAAHFLGINSGLLVASWDNLTNKGLVKYQPSKIFIWNEYQKKEATKLHKIPDDKIEVMGSPTFDNWFTLKPSMSKESFLTQAGLPIDRNYILYLCSSKSIVKDETIFFEKWYHNLKRQEGKKLKELTIIVRPHPKYEEQWEQFDLSRFENVSIYPLKRNFSLGFDNAKTSFYDSLFYSELVVGINTTSMIEAGILQKPVFTIIPKTNECKIHEGTYGTLHFKYLLDGGLVQFADNFQEHYRQMNFFLNLSDDKRTDYLRNIHNFVKKFVRPNGLEQNVVELYFQKVLAMSPKNIKPKKNLSHNSILSFLTKVLLMPWRFELYYDRNIHKIVIKTPLGSSKSSKKQKKLAKSI